MILLLALVYQSGFRGIEAKGAVDVHRGLATSVCFLCRCSINYSDAYGRYHRGTQVYHGGPSTMQSERPIISKLSYILTRAVWYRILPMLDAQGFFDVDSYVQSDRVCGTILTTGGGLPYTLGGPPTQ